MVSGLVIKNIPQPDGSQLWELVLWLFLLKIKTMELRFHPGDRVMPVGGGPEMTIRDQHYDVNVDQYRNDMFDCIWFVTNPEGKGEVRYSPFHEDDLLKTGNA